MMVPAGINTVERKKIKKDIAAQSSFVKKHVPLFRRSSIPPLLIIIVGFLIYSNTFHIPFLFDDEINIYKNPMVRDIGYFLQMTVSDIIFNSRIVCFFTFAMNYAMHGLNVVGYHLGNLFIHLGCALLLYCFCILTFKTPYFSDNFPEPADSSFHTPRIITLFTALLFVSHPIQTQAVTYIVQRLASLATFFYLFSLVTYIKFRLSESPKARYVFYAASVISAILAMKTKEIAFTLPVMVILYEFMFFRGAIRKRIIYLIPLTLTMIIIPLSLIGGVQGSSPDSAVRIDELTKGASLNIISAGDYLNTQFRVIVTYIRLLFLPINQNLDYDYPIYKTFFTPPVFFSFLFLLAIFGWGVYLLYRSFGNKGVQESSLKPDSRFRGKDRKWRIKTFPETSGDENERKCWYRLIAFGIFWFFVTLSIESSIIPIADVIVEHRLYLPSVGFILVFVGVVVLLAGKLLDSIFAQRMATVVLVLMVICLSATAYARNIIWQSEVSLWEDTVKKSPNSYRANFNVGFYHAMQGRYDDAIKEFDSAIRINPHYADAYNNLGLCYLHKGQLDMAFRAISVAVRLTPGAANIQESLGQVFMAQGEYDKASEAFKSALKLEPSFVDARNNLEKVESILNERRKGRR